MKPKKQHTLLVGEGIHQHTLYGDFLVEEKTEFPALEVTKDSVLRHEKPDGSFGEHQPLKVEQGNWSMGKQVEYNPFENNITQVWD
jgi:hypothetical protein